MKKNLLIILLLLVEWSPAQTFSGRANYYSASYGFYSQNVKSFQEFTQALSATFDAENMRFRHFGPVALKGEFSLSDRLGFGPYLAYEQINLTVNDKSKNTFYKIDFVMKVLSLAVRGNYHFRSRGSVFDPFLGFGLGANMHTFNRSIYEKRSYPAISENFPSSYTTARFYVKRPYFISATLGTRVYFLPHWAFVVESGWEKGALLHTGLVYKTKNTTSSRINQ